MLVPSHVMDKCMFWADYSFFGVETLLCQSQSIEAAFARRTQNILYQPFGTSCNTEVYDRILVVV